MGFPNFEKKTFTSISIIYVSLYFLIVVLYSYNFPYYDDYAAILESVLKMNSSESVSDFFHALFVQHSEHRIVFTRLIAWLSTFFTSQINFNWLVLFGNSALPIILFLFYKITSNVKSDLQTVLIGIVFLIFNFQSYSNTFWAMSGIQNFWVLAWALLFFYQLFKDNFNISIIFLVLAAFTSGNGIFLVPVGSVLLISLKREKEAIWLILIGLVIAFFYFKGFHAKQYLIENQTITENIARILKFLGAFVGSFFFHPSFSIISVTVGWFIILFYIYLFAKNYFLRNPTLFAFYSFLLLTALVVSITRSRLGFEFAATSRYKINSILLIACFFLTWFDTIKTSKYILWATVGVLFVFNSYINYFYFSKVIQAKQLRKADAWLWQQNKTPHGHPDSLLVRAVLNNAERENLFITDKIAEAELFQTKKNAPVKKQNLPLEFNIDFVSEKKGFVCIKGWAKFKGRKANFLKSSFICSDNNNPKIIETLYQIRFDVAAKQKSFDYLESGFLVFIPKSDFNTLKGFQLTDNQKFGFIELTSQNISDSINYK